MQKRMYMPRRSNSTPQKTFQGGGQLNETTGQFQGEPEIDPMLLFAQNYANGVAVPEVDMSFLVQEEEIVEEEPSYANIDEYGNEVATDGHTPAWKLPKGEFTQEVFDACHIKYWGTREQKSGWRKIQSELFSKYGQEIKIRRAWVVAMISWANIKNEGRYVTVIHVDRVISAINNDTQYQQFKTKYFEKGMNNYA
jgi:hypothetical protein